MARTMLLATSDSEVAKKPRLRLTMSRSSGVRPEVDFQSAMSACIATSVGIQWLLQPARYFSQAHWYLRGSSWLTSAWALIMAFSLTMTRPAPRSMRPRPVPSAASAGGGIGTVAVGNGSFQLRVIGRYGLGCFD